MNSMNNPMSQNQVNRVWDDEWHKEGNTAKAVFNHRLFVEGYPIVKKHIPQGVTSILDAGGGTGRYAIKFAQDYPLATVYATDLLPSSLDVMRSIADEVGVSKIIFQQEDVTKLNFTDNHFDVVYCGMLLQILPNVELAFREFARVLKPGGTLIVTTVNFWNFHSLNKWIRTMLDMPEYYVSERAFTRAELADLARRNELIVATLDGFYPAYGIYRMKTYWGAAAFIGKILNRINRILDPLTGRFLSRYFGFEIFVVAKKKQH